MYTIVCPTVKASPKMKVNFSGITKFCNYHHLAATLTISKFHSVFQQLTFYSYTLILDNSPFLCSAQYLQHNTYNYVLYEKKVQLTTAILKDLELIM